ncbi:hypothetical protein [Massilia sp. TSP1-1-2]|uniref:hypothetical protein n=1 Tax=Massilia sp. TSP1-1-2 TaxID=2804649 RepID=UPI003CEF881A
MPVVPDHEGAGATERPALPHLPSDKSAYTALLELREIVASEGYAMTALTLGGYRSDLLVTIKTYIKDCKP